MPVGTYQSLNAWQAAMDLVCRVYEAASRFPNYENYGLGAQMRRSAVSVASNIAEGHGRAVRGDYHRFVSIAIGSLAELETQIIVAHRLAYLDDAREQRLLRDTDCVGRMLRGLQRTLRPGVKAAREPQ